MFDSSEKGVLPDNGNVVQYECKHQSYYRKPQHKLSIIHATSQSILFIFNQITFKVNFCIRLDIYMTYISILASF